MTIPELPEIALFLSPGCDSRHHESPVPGPHSPGFFFFFPDSI
jgi:hypothetical protein